MNLYEVLKKLFSVEFFTPIYMGTTKYKNTDTSTP